MAVKFKPAKKDRKSAGVKFTGNQELQYAPPAPTPTPEPMSYAPGMGGYYSPWAGSIPYGYGYRDAGAGGKLTYKPWPYMGGLGVAGSGAAGAGSVPRGPAVPPLPAAPLVPAPGQFTGALYPWTGRAATGAGASGTGTGAAAGAGAGSGAGATGGGTGWGPSPAQRAPGGFYSPGKYGDSWRPAYQTNPSQGQSPNGWFMDAQGRYIPNFAPGASSSGNSNVQSARKWKVRRTGSRGEQMPGMDNPIGTPPGTPVQELWPGQKPGDLNPNPGGAPTIWNPASWGQQSVYGGGQVQSTPRWLQSMVNWMY